VPAILRVLLLKSGKKFFAANYFLFFTIAY